jgi:hypothetical protein
LNNRKIDQIEIKSKGFKFYDPNLENKGNKREKMRLNAFKFSEIDHKLNDIKIINNFSKEKNEETIIPKNNSDVKLLLENHIKTVKYIRLNKIIKFNTSKKKNIYISIFLPQK